MFPSLLSCPAMMKTWPLIFLSRSFTNLLTVEMRWRLAFLQSEHTHLGQFQAIGRDTHCCRFSGSGLVLFHLATSWRHSSSSSSSSSFNSVDQALEYSLIQSGLPGAASVFVCIMALILSL